MKAACRSCFNGTLQPMSLERLRNRSRLDRHVGGPLPHQQRRIEERHGSCLHGTLVPDTQFRPLEVGIEQQRALA